MNTAEQILVIVLAATLAVLLVLAIVTLAQLIKLLKTLRHIAETAQQFVDSAEATADMVKSTFGRLTVMRFMHSLISLVTKRKEK